jgi:hypothetical protein
MQGDSAAGRQKEDRSAQCHPTRIRISDARVRPHQELIDVQVNRRLVFD